MDVARKYEKLLKSLMALAENPSTPDEEADNAMIRIAEIEKTIRKSHEAELNRKQAISSSREKPRRKLNISDLKKVKRGQKKIARFETEWPFGWTMRGRIQVECISFPLEKKFVLEWKCPSCGLIVERTITPRHRARLLVKPDGVEEFVSKIRSGELNQLCDDCWEKYQ